MKHLQSATFRGVEFRIDIGRAPRGVYIMGATTSRRSKQKRLFLDERLWWNRRKLFEVAIHEALHACFDAKLTEREVKAAGVDIARFVERIFRVAKHPPRKEPK